jgi:acylphosphatase
MPTGEVQVVASGAPERLSEFERCLEEGPRMSRVTAVHRLPAPEQDFSGFSVRY